MSRWFRMYDELLDDPKVQQLSSDDFKGWVNLLCLTSRKGGKLPRVSDIAFALRETEESVSTLLERLLNGGLIEKRSGGADGVHYAPNKWSERQYKSDTSTGRVKRFRERSKPVTETPPETETETDSTLAKANALDPEKVMFDQGVMLLGLAGIKPARARPMLGRWKRDHGAGAVIEALGAAQRLNAIDPISFIEGRFLNRARSYDPERITV